MLLRTLAAYAEEGLAVRLGRPRGGSSWVAVPDSRGPRGVYGLSAIREGDNAVDNADQQS
jgi:hypothetical protein